MRLASLVYGVTLSVLGIDVAFANDRSITVDVTVRDRLGAPVADVYVGTASDKSNCVTKTSEDGVAHLVLSVPDTWAGSLFYGIVPWAKFGGDPETFGASPKFDALVKENSFPLFQSVDVSVDVNAYSVQLAAVEPYSVRGRVKWSDGETCRAYVRACYLRWPGATSRSDGTFQVFGLPQDRESVVVIHPMEQAMGLQIWTVPPANGDAVDLGDLVIQRPENAKAVDIEVTSRSSLGWKPGHMWDSSGTVSCVSVDGMRYFVFAVNDENNKAWRGSYEVTAIPPGEYFLAPGIVDGQNAAYRVAELIHAGRMAELIIAGVPRLVVPSEGPVPSVTFDAAAVEERVMRIAQ